jgi:Abi-like protein
MRQSLRNIYLSSSRYSRYLIAVGNDTKKAKRLYNANIRLAQAFHPVISQFEVVLRNCIHNRLSVHFNDADWILNQRQGFMNHQSLSFSNYFLKACVNKTRNNLIRRNVNVTSGKIISDQTFGFWVAFFLSHHYGLLSGQLIHIFPNKPASENRAHIYDKLDKIKNFRNRVNHCEPLCFSGNAIDCTEAVEIMNLINDLLNWIDPELSDFFSGLDNIQTKVNNILSL